MTDRSGPHGDPPDIHGVARLFRRRAVLLGAGAVGVAGVLAACSTDSSTPGARSSSTNPDAGGGGQSTSEPTGAADDGDGASTGLATTEEVPVGGGIILTDREIVITQPAEGDFHAFSAICTHQGCLVGSVADGQIACPCHGSHYSIDDGSVLSGPAPAPLPTVDITVQGDEIIRS